MMFEAYVTNLGMYPERGVEVGEVECEVAVLDREDGLDHPEVLRCDPHLTRHVLAGVGQQLGQ